MRIAIVSVFFSVVALGAKDPYVSSACKLVAPGLKLKADRKSKSYRLVGGKNFKKDVAALNANGSANVVVEIPSGCNDKWEVDDSGTLFWDIKRGRPRFIGYLPYLGNYGMIPQTLQDKADGGDGDPLDVLVLGPARPRGSVVQVRMVGVLMALDGGERDDKLIAVLTEKSPDNPFSSVRKLGDLKDKKIIDIVKSWFENYKGPGKMKVTKVLGAKQAEKVLKKAVHAFRKSKG